MAHIGQNVPLSTLLDEVFILVNLESNNKGVWDKIIPV